MHISTYLSRIQQNIAPLVSAVFIAYFCLVLFTYQSYRKQLHELNEIITASEIESHKMLLNSELMELARKRTRLTSEIIDTTDVFIQDELNIQLEIHAGQFAERRAALLQLDVNKEEKAELDSHTDIIKSILPAQRRAVELAMSDEPQNIAESSDILYQIVLPGQSQLIDSFSRLISIEKKTITDLKNKASQSMHTINERMSLLVYITLSLIVVLSIIVIVRIRSIQSNLLEHQQNLEQNVKKRTQELSNSNIALEESLNEIRQTQERLIESEKLSALGTLVAGVAHEVNTPIGISMTANSNITEQIDNIKTSLENNAIKKSELESFLRDSAKSSKILDTNLKRAADLISSFKQVSADQNMDNAREFNLCEYLNNIVTSIEPQLKRTPHKVRVHCSDSITIHSIPGAFSQILTNLIMNSLTHGYDELYREQQGEDSSGQINIIASIEEDTGKLIIDYHDTGRGMTEEQLKHIFEPFYTTRRESGGTGLGMFVVYNLVVQKLGGDINCYSEPGEGLHAVIELPAKKRVA